MCLESGTRIAGIEYKDVTGNSIVKAIFHCESDFSFKSWQNSCWEIGTESSPLVPQKVLRVFGSFHPDGREKVSISEGNNNKPAFALPFIHVMKQRSTAHNADVQRMKF